MDLSFLPNNIYNALKVVDLDKLYEIRLRKGFPILLNVNNDRLYLTVNGGKKVSNESIICQSEDIESIIKKVCEHSIYAYNDKICAGFLTTKDGIRLGLAGECVFEKDKILTIKNFSSLNIRIPHEIINCSKQIFNNITNEKSIYNTLIVSPPFCGKTTILKDLARNIDYVFNFSILIIDERGEFSNVKGQNIDVLTYSNKEYALNVGVRVLSPNVIITDELCGESDWQCVKKASNSGVKIIASIHAETIDDVKKKEYFDKSVFDRYVLLKSCGQPGVLNKVFNGNFLEI